MALADFDALRLWEPLGYPSLFDFVHRELGVSRSAAYYRITAARLVREYPEIVQPLRDGRLCVTNVVELSKAITPENKDQVLPRYYGVSKLEARTVTVTVRPMAVVPTRSVVTAVRAAPLALEVAPPPPSPARPAQEPDAVRPVGLGPAATPPAGPAPARSERRTGVEPISADLARLHLTVPARLVKKLEAARDALSHARPDASDADVIEAALDLLLLAKAQKRKGVTDRPQKTPRPSRTNRIPAHVRRAVVTRDQGCCAWKLDGGGVCGSRRRLQFDHVVPEALGGPSTVENVRLLCQVHNQYAARLVFGEALMERYRRKTSAARDASPSGLATTTR